MIKINHVQPLLLALIAAMCLNSGMAEAAHRPSVLFIHHSVGESIIRDGSLRAIFAEAGFDFWDHGYNHPETGLKNEKGEPAGSYNIPDDNTTPYGYAKLFALDPEGDNAFSRLLNNHDIILFKSCFPASKIQENRAVEDRLKPWRRSLGNYKRYYLAIRDHLHKYSEKKFVAITPPPLHPGATDSAEAKRAREFTKWLQSEEFLNGSKNIFIFDLFNILADPDTNTLRRKFHLNPASHNSHPNPAANLLIAQNLSDFVINTAYTGAIPPVTQGFDLESGSIIREVQPMLTLTSVVGKNTTADRLFWSDLEGRSGELDTKAQTPFIYKPLREGVTRLLFTAKDASGFRTSAIIGVRYTANDSREKLIFGNQNRSGTIRGITEAERQMGKKSKELVIKGNGSRRRIVIDDLAIDISGFDPQRSILEMTYDQGDSSARPRLVIPGVFSEEFASDNQPGYQQIRFDPRDYEYLINSLNRIIIKGKWEKNETASIRSLKLFRR
jgi:hypothetical protein